MAEANAEERDKGKNAGNHDLRNGNYDRQGRGMETGRYLCVEIWTFCAYGEHIQN